MKDQMNLIVSIVAPLIAVIAITALWFTKPEPKAPAAVTPVPLTAAPLPAGPVVVANALPGAGSGPGAGAGGGAGIPTFSPAGGPPSFGAGGPSMGGTRGGAGKMMPGSNSTSR